MKYVIATATAFLAVAVQGNLLFLVSTEPNNKGIQYSWVTDRWVCHNLVEEGLYKNISWAFVASGLANGCTLYEDKECTGASANIEKNNSNILGPGPVNLTDVNFDKKASSWSCY